MEYDTPPALKDILSLPRYAKDVDLLRNMLAVIAGAAILAVGLIYLHYQKALTGFMEANKAAAESPYDRRFQYMDHVGRFFRYCFELEVGTYEDNLKKASVLASAEVLEKIKQGHRKEKMLDMLALYDNTATRIRLDSIRIDALVKSGAGRPANGRGVLFGRQELLLAGQVKNARLLICSFHISDLSTNSRANPDGAMIISFDVEQRPISSDISSEISSK